MQAMAAPRPRRGLAAGDMLARHPPARYLLRRERVAQIVDDEDVSDIARHLRRDIGVALIHIKAMDTDAAGLVMADELGSGRHRDVIDLEAAVLVAALLKILQRAKVGLRYAHLCRSLLQRRRTTELSRQRAFDCRQLLGAPADPAHIALVIDGHDVAGDANLVAVGL